MDMGMGMGVGMGMGMGVGVARTWIGDPDVTRITSTGYPSTQSVSPCNGHATAM